MGKTRFRVQQKLVDLQCIRLEESRFVRQVLIAQTVDLKCLLIDLPNRQEFTVEYRDRLLIIHRLRDADRDRFGLKP